MNHANRQAKLWWSLVAALMLAFAWNVAHGLVNGDADVAATVAEGLVTAMLIVPVTGYVRQVPYHPRMLWVVVLWACVLVAALGLAGIATSLAQGGSMLDAALGALWLALALPCLFAIDQYANRSHHLWSAGA